MSSYLNGCLCRRKPRKSTSDDPAITSTGTQVQIVLHNIPNSTNKDLASPNHLNPSIRHAQSVSSNSDCGAPTENDWERAKTNFLRRLPRNLEDQFEAVSNIHELLDEVKKQQEKYTDTLPLQKTMDRVQKFAKGLEVYFGAADVLCQMGTPIGSTVWGSLKLLITILGRSGETLNNILSAFEEIEDDIARVQETEMILKKDETRDPRVERLFFKVYESLLDVCLFLLKYCQEHWSVNAAKNPLMPTRVNDFQAKFKKLKRTIENIDKEPVLALIRNMKSRPVTDITVPCRIIPYPPEKRSFFDRPKLYEKLTSWLSPDSSREERRRFYLYGMSGVGKTQLALQFAYNNGFDVVVWFQANDEPKILNGFEIAGRQLLVKVTDETDQSAFRKEVKIWLQTTTMRWLAIFDNVDDYNILRDNIPSEDKGCILITSNRKPELGITAVEKMEVEVFPETEASAFMVSLMKEAMDNSPGKATLIPDPTDPGLKKLVTEIMGGLALGIKQAATYMCRVQCNVKEYIQLYESDRDGTLYDELYNSPGENGSVHERGLKWSIGKAIEQVARQCPEAITLINLFSCLDAETIPLSLFEDIPKDKLPDQLKFLASPIKVMQARGFLLESLLVKLTGNGFSYHRFWMDVRRKQLDVDARQKAFNHALFLLYQAFPPKNDDHSKLKTLKPQADQLLVHVDVLAKRFKESPRPAPELRFAMLLDKASYYLLQRGASKLAEQYAGIMEEICEPMGVSKERNVTLANAYHLRGRLLHFLGSSAEVSSNKECFQLEKKAILLRQSVGNPNPKMDAASYGQLAIWALTDSDYEESLKQSRECLQIRLKKFPGEEVENLSVTYQNLGHCFQFMGRFDEAKANIQKSIDVIEEKFKDDANSVAQYAWAFYRLGSFHEARGEMEQAYTAYRKGLDLKLTAEDENPFAAQFKVSYCLMYRGELDTARTEIENSIKHMREEGIPSQEALARALYLHGEILDRLGEPDLSKAKKVEAAEIRQRVAGIKPEVDDCLDAYSKLVFFWDW